MWRILYWFLARRATVRLAALALRSLERRRGRPAVDRVLDGLGALLIWSGWPLSPGARAWMNLDASRFVARVRQELTGAGARHALRPASVDDRPVRVGLVGRFSGLLTFARYQFEAAPAELEISLFDIAYRGRDARYLKEVVPHYHGFRESAAGEDRALAEELAAAVDDAALDLLLVVDRTPVAYDLVGLADTPCVGYVCTGSDLLYHEGVDFHIFCQPQADYFVRGDRLFCGTSRSWFGDERTYPGFLFLDPRDLGAESVVPWRERDRLVVFHGSLYKLASPRFLDCIFGLLQEDPSLEFVYMGGDVADARAAIELEARRKGVGACVHYDGEFSAVRAGPVDLEDPGGWERLCNHLRRARLAPDPWPVGGAASRLEAYLLGTPSVHMCVDFEPAAWGRPQPALVELPLLLVPDGSASSVAEYRQLCHRCLNDADFAERLVDAQLEVAGRATDATAYWTQILDLYGRWRRDVGVD